MTSQAPAYFRAVTIDYDGTLADGPVKPDTRACCATATPPSSSTCPTSTPIDGPPGRAVLAWRQHPRQPAAFTIGARATAYPRHEHKYDQAGVEPSHRFHFRTEPGTPTGAVAANLADLEAELAGCDESVLRHHCPGHDFSRWVADVFHDGPLPADLAAAEAALTRRGPAAVVEQARLTLIPALQDRLPR